MASRYHLIHSAASSGLVIEHPLGIRVVLLVLAESVMVDDRRSLRRLALLRFSGRGTAPFAPENIRCLRCFRSALRPCAQV